MGKTYLVETWDKAGVKQNNYEVVIDTPAGLKSLHKFLMAKFGHVAISPVSGKPAAKRSRK